MAETPNQKETQNDIITSGYLEKEYNISSKEAGKFLAELGEQLQEGDEVKIEGDGWEIPFAFSEPVEVEIEFDGSDSELEFEIELEGGADEGEIPEIS